MGDLVEIGLKPVQLTPKERRHVLLDYAREHENYGADEGEGILFLAGELATRMRLYQAAMAGACTVSIKNKQLVVTWLDLSNGHTSAEGLEPEQEEA